MINKGNLLIYNGMMESNALNSDISEKSVGLILQRGGEEIALVKVSDRFTVCFNSTSASLPPSIPLINHQTIPYRSSQENFLQIEEVIIAPKDLEEGMTLAREAETIAFASHVYQLQNNPETLVYLTNQLTIQFSVDLKEEIREAIAEQFNLELLQTVAGIPNTFVYQLTQQTRENPIKIANRLIGQPEILTAEANIILTQESFYRPSDSFYPQQWYLQHNGGFGLEINSHIQAEQAWDITRGNRSVVVAIADDAIDINHPDFQGEGKIVAPKDFKDQDFLPLPESTQESHGTACAGVAVAEETGTGVVGVAPGCSLMPLRTTGFLDDQSIEELFDWVIEKEADVISCSWGASAINFPLSLRQSAAINRAANQGRQGKGCVIIFAAGNANRPINGTIYERSWPNQLLYGPTKWLSGFPVHPDVIAVSACTSLNKKSAYSNWGTNISVCAPSNNGAPGMWFPKTGFMQTAPEVNVSLPGRGIFTTDQLGEVGYDTGNFTRDFGGTSSACPVVAGVAALILSVNPELNAPEVKDILQQTADKIVDLTADPQLGLQMGTYDHNGHSQWFGYGKVNAFQAVKAAQQSLQISVITRIIQAQNHQPVEIPDDNPQGIVSSIQVDESEIVQDIQVSVEIDHEFLGDIEISIRTPNDLIVLLQNRTLATETKLKTTYTVDNTPTLKQLINQPTAGVWWLWIVDYAPQDTGILKSWELKLSV